MRPANGSPGSRLFDPGDLVFAALGIAWVALDVTPRTWGSAIRTILGVGLFAAVFLGGTGAVRALCPRWVERPVAGFGQRMIVCYVIFVLFALLLSAGQV